MVRAASLLIVGEPLFAGPGQQFFRFSQELDCLKQSSF